MAVRFYVKSILEPVLPELPVLSYQEIEEDVRLQTIGWVKKPGVSRWPSQGENRERRGRFTWGRHTLADAAILDITREALLLVFDAVAAGRGGSRPSRR